MTHAELRVGAGPRWPSVGTPSRNAIEDSPAAFGDATWICPACPSPPQMLSLPPLICSLVPGVFVPMPTLPPLKYELPDPTSWTLAFPYGAPPELDTPPALATADAKELLLLAAFCVDEVPALESIVLHFDFYGRLARIEIAENALPPNVQR